jgi:3-hydroxyisobutyrate dehydrogenase-like beta-hydroxyacid dehydrogenase
MATIAVLGAGLLGAGFVENLLAKGESVRVWNRTAAKLAPLVEKGAVAAESPADAVAGAERVHLILTADDAVDETIGRFLPSLPAGVPILDHSTNLPARVRERSVRLRGAGVAYLHAPVFMSPQNGREGTGLMLVAGPAAEVEALTPALSRMTGRVWHCGERPDQAAVLKLVGNGSLVSMSAMLGDLFSMAGAEGVAPEDVLGLFEVFRAGHGLPMIGQRVLTRGTKPASFELSMARKDVRLMIETAGGPDGLVVLPAVAAAMDQALAEGHAAKDYAIYAWPRGRSGGSAS